ncbi:MAG: aminotransferase class V-fold PLP-dependent enzyme [Saprospiraceae bacterium]
MSRRSFLKGAGVVLGGSAFLPVLSKVSEFHTPISFESWTAVRQQFLFDPNYIHMSQMLLAAHPRMVRDEIQRHRRLFDENPAEYWENNFMTIENKITESAAAYMKCAPEEIALTDSTTQGLGILYNGFKLKPGDEILTSIHDHYVTEKSLAYASAKNGASIRRMTLYTEPANASITEIVETVSKEIRPATRMIAITWVHSSTGVKLPIKEIGEVIKKANEQRSPKERIYYCVDGVHNFGIGNIDIKELGCDFFAAGTHKWIFGPRGTGILYGKKDAWDMVAPTFASFTGEPFGMWLGMIPEGPASFRDLCTPGGFHSFELRWSLPKAFEFHQQIGKTRVEERTHHLSSLLKEGLHQLKSITLHTPVSPSLSAGINAFEVKGIKPEDVVKKLFAKKIIASSSPYRVSYARLTPNIANTEEEVKACLKALESLKV